MKFNAFKFIYSKESKYFISIILRKNNVSLVAVIDKWIFLDVIIFLESVFPFKLKKQTNFDIWKFSLKQ